MKRTWTVVGIIGVALAVPSTAAADTPDPFGAPGCNGNVVATINHASGEGANDSRGPGFTFRNGQDVKAAITGVRGFVCG